MISNEGLTDGFKSDFQIDPEKTASRGQIPPQNGAKTALRMRYMAEVEVIKRDLGGLEDIRERLQLSRRKMCQKLLVDPSAWTRWTRDEDKVPPHIWKMLSYLTEDSAGKITRSEKEKLSEKIHGLEASLRVQSQKIGWLSILFMGAIGTLCLYIVRFEIGSWIMGS